MLKTNNGKEAFTSGQHGYDSVLFLIVSNGGAGMIINFISNVNNSSEPKSKRNHNHSVDSVELKFNPSFVDEHVQIWGINQFCETW